VRIKCEFGLYGTANANINRTLGWLRYVNVIFLKYDLLAPLVVTSHINNIHTVLVRPRSFSKRRPTVNACSNLPTDMDFFHLSGRSNAKSVHLDYLRLCV